MNIPNIAFIGKAGAGKTTASEVLGWFPNLGYQRISFAEPLKVGLGTSTDRQRLQEFGTDVVRRYDPDFWVRLFFWHLDLRNQIRDGNDCATTEPRWVNDDCRFPNELAALQDAGWVVIEITAPRATRLDRLRLNGKLSDESQLDHESETAIDGFVPDYQIVNDGTESDLAAAIAHKFELMVTR